MDWESEESCMKEGLEYGREYGVKDVCMYDLQIKDVWCSLAILSTSRIDRWLEISADANLCGKRSSKRTNWSCDIKVCDNWWESASWSCYIDACFRSKHLQPFTIN